MKASCQAATWSQMSEITLTGRALMDGSLGGVDSWGFLVGEK